MQYNISAIQQVNRFLTHCIMYFIIFATVLILYDNGNLKFYRLIGIPAILIFYFFIERYIFNGFLYLLLHGIVLIPVLLIPFPSKAYTLLYCILIVVECIHGEYIWKHNMDAVYGGAPWEFYLFAAFISLVAKAYHYDRITDIVFYCGILLLILHFIQLYMEGLRTVLQKSGHATSLPAKKMIFFSSLMVSFIILVFLISCIYSQKYDIDSSVAIFGKWLGTVILAIIKWILYLFTLIRAYFAKNRQLQNLAQRQGDYQNTFGAVADSLTNPTLIEHIIYGILAICVYALILYILYRIFKSIYKTYSKRYITDSDTITPITPQKEQAKKIRHPKNRISHLRENLSGDNRIKLRNIYRLFIRRHKKYEHKSSNTVTDIQNDIKELYSEDISQLSALYEKARYSSHAITNEDVQKGGSL